MRAILFRHLIGVNCILYMAPDPLLQVSDVLIYMDATVKNVIQTIGQALEELAKPGTYGE